MSPALPRIPADPAALDGLRRLLLERNGAINDSLGKHPGVNSVVDVGLYERRLAQDPSDSAVLATLFRLSQPVLQADAVRALAPVKVEDLTELGLIALEGGYVRPVVRIGVHEGAVIASDVAANPHPSDFVTGPSPAAERVERLTIRRPVHRALDLGTGPGIQAVLAARHSGQVVAVDLNERAVVFTRFNAALNQISNIEVLRGDWLEPVAGERFDLIVSNPPYVVSPETGLFYRDGQLLADAVSRKLVEAVPAHLEEGGFGQVMVNWTHGLDEDWRAPLERWIAGSGCDALLLRYASADLVLYAASWNTMLVNAGAKPFLTAVDRWLEYYRREGIEAISDGMIVLRRRSTGPNWVRAIEVPGRPAASAGDHVSRLFAARDRRDELTGDDAVLAAMFLPAPGLNVITRRELSKEGNGRASVSLEAGIGFAVSVPPALADGLSRLDGTRTLAEAVGSSNPGIAGSARRLFALGMLVLA